MLITAATRRPDIVDRDDVTALLEDFYGRAFDDELLRPVFVDIAHMNLRVHMPVICEFWLTVLFHTGQYRRNALQPHLRLHERAHLTAAHFERWLTLWLATVDDRHAGPTAELAKLQATRIAGSMARRLARVECAAQVDEIRNDHEAAATRGLGFADPVAVTEMTAHPATACVGVKPVG